MSGLLEGTGSSRGASQDFEINIASIIDCFTVLIAFMLASASFLSIGILDAGIAAGGAAATDQATPPPVNVTLELSSDHHMTLKLEGKSNSTTTINPTADKKAWDFEAMAKDLASVKAQWPMVQALTLKADDNVEYNEVVQTMEAARKSLPVVLLGGF